MCSLYYLYIDKRDNILRERYMGESIGDTQRDVNPEGPFYAL